MLKAVSTSITTPGSIPVNVMDFGAVNSTGLHPLSDYFATLADAQAIYPSATALTDEIDTVAIEKALAYCVTNNRDTLYFPPSATVGGSYKINKFIVVPYVSSGRQGVIKLLGDSATADQKNYVACLQRTISAAGFQFYGTSLATDPSNKLMKKNFIQGLTFDGGWAAYNTDAIYPYLDFDSCYELFMEDVVVTQTLGQGLFLREVMDSRLYNCRITWCGQHSGFQKSITTTNTSTTATFNTTVGLFAGQRIYGTGLNNVKIASIDSATQVTLSTAANFTGSRTVVLEAKAAMHVCSNDTANATSNNIVFNGTRFENGGATALRVEGSNIIDIWVDDFKAEYNNYALDYLVDIDNCSGIDIKNKAWLYMNPNYLNYMENTATTGATTLASLSSAALASFTLNNVYYTSNGTVTNGSPIVTGITSTATLFVGQAVSGTGISSTRGTYIQSIDSGTQITMTNNAVSTGTIPLTFQILWNSGNFNLRQFYAGMSVIAYDASDPRNYLLGRVTNYTQTTGALSLYVGNVFGNTAAGITNWKIAACTPGLAKFWNGAKMCSGDFIGLYASGTPVTSLPYVNSFVHLDGVKGYEGTVRCNSGAKLLPKNSFQSQTATNSITVGTGAKTFTIATGLPADMYVANAAVFISGNTTATAQNWMRGTITSYTSGTGALVCNITETNGSGTLSDWNITFDTQAAVLETTATGSNSGIFTKEFYAEYGTPASYAYEVNNISSNPKKFKGSSAIKNRVSTTSTIYATNTPDSASEYVLTDTGIQYLGSTVIGGSSVIEGNIYLDAATIAAAITNGGSITLEASARVPYTINGLYGVATASGTITIAIKINSTSVTGLSAVAVTSTPATATATALNTVAVGDKVTLVLSSNASANGLEFTAKRTLR